MNRLYEQLGKLPAKEIVVALDSCFSGMGGRSVIAKGARPLVIHLQRELILPRNILITRMAAASANQISSTYEGNSHGAVYLFYAKWDQE